MARLVFGLLVLLLVIAGGGGCSKAARTSRYLARADQDFKAERYDKAEVEYLATLRISPGEHVAINRLGLIYYAEGKLPQACAYLLKGLEIQPGDIEARVKLGRAFLALRDLRDARLEAIRVLDRQPGNEDALLLLAGTTFTTNQWQEALQLFEAAPQAAKEHAGYHAAKGVLSLQRRELEQGEAELKQAAALDPKSITAFMALGELYVQRGDVKRAEGALKTAAEVAPLRSPARLRYADFMVKKGATDAGKEIVQDITKQAPDYVPAWVFLAQLAFALQRTEECETLISRALARDPVNLDALVLKGNLLMAKGEATNAVGQFERILSINLYKKVPQVQYRLALSQLQSGTTAKAVQTLNATLANEPNFTDATLLLANLNIRKGDTASAVLSLKQLIVQQPQVAQAHLLLATAHLVQRQPEEAMAVYRHMAELFPKSPEVPQLRGILLAQQKNAVEARKAFEKSLEIAPGYLPALESLVDLDISEKQYVAAKERIRKQMEKNKEAAGPWLLLAKVAMAEAMGYEPDVVGTAAGSAQRKLLFSQDPAAQAQVKEAETALLKAVSLEPGLSTSYLLLARLYVAAGKQQAALDRLNGFVSKTNDVAALMQIGLIQEQLKDYPAARDAYEKILTVNPRFSPSLNNLAYLYSERLGQLEKAYQMAQKARQLMPYDPSTADTLGWVLYKRGEYSRALGLLEESADKLPGEPEVQFHLGMTHYMLGEEELARAQLEAGVDSNKEFPGKEEGRRCLEILALNPKTADAAAVEKLQRWLHEAPNDPVACSRLGAIQERDGKFAQAAETYRFALKKNPKNLQLILRLARLDYRPLRRVDEAFELAKNAHSLAPEDAQVSHLLGQLAYETRDYSWACSLLEEAARKLPQDAELAYDLGWSYYSLGRVADAEAKMRIAVQVGGDSNFVGEARRFLAMAPANREATSTQAMVTEARNALTRNPDYVPALMISAFGEENDGKYEEAARSYNRVLDRYPLFLPATKRLAVLYFAHLGNDEKASELASKARAADAQDPEIAKVLGVIAYRRGEFGRSAQLLEESSGRRRGDAELFYYLGMTRYRLKDAARSKAALHQALDLNLSAQFVNEARRVLKDLEVKGNG